MSKPIILTFVGNYLPGYKAGGILRSIANLVDNLSNCADFWIVTRDRDLGDHEPYSGITVDRWEPTPYGMLHYVSPDRCTVFSLAEIVRSTPHDVLYLNSYFDRLTVFCLLNRKLGRLSSNRTIVAPRGEFGWASLKQKYLKKLAYMMFARSTGLHSGVIWHASSDIEAMEVAEVLHVCRREVHVALDLAAVRSALPLEMDCAEEVPPNDELRVVFLSRIAREKNLHYALETLRRVSVQVRFDIYGPLDNARYWHECCSVIPTLPPNVKVKYYGPHPEPLKVLARYDVHFLPTGGENYGQVIAETLMTGTPVVISDMTPWRNLERDRLGWDIPLAERGRFIGVIESLARMSGEERMRLRRHIREKVWDRLEDAVALDANRHLFGISKH